MKERHMAKRKQAGTFDAKQMAQQFSLLSDATRLGILSALAKGPQSVTALCKALKIKQPTVSHHIGQLRMGRLVTGTRKGTSVEYEMNAANLREMADALAGLIRG
jgi:DNA-binding transcriptional ArsR family regulator